jgi:GTP-binding protein
MKAIVFRDQVKLYVVAGDGGDGSAFFRREKHVPLGGPSGGDGGDGGDVLLVGDEQIDSLLHLYDRPHQRAQHGEKGGTNQSYGKRGEVLRVKVPRGTIVRLENKDGPILGEIMKDGEELLVAKGGIGGKGNVHFKTSSNQAPKECTPGTEGENRILWLELKLIADVGLVGYPNAGKSTLISKMTHAHPKIASYPFTTLNPIIGTLEYPDFKRIRIADIPGLIDGAHEGIGLGHEFLRHIERTRLMLFVIDMGGVDGRDPVEDFNNLREELRLFNPELEERPYRVVANKMDEPESDANLERFQKETGERPIRVIAELGEGIDALIAELHASVFGDNPPPDLLA